MDLTLKVSIAMKTSENGNYTDITRWTLSIEQHCEIRTEVFKYFSIRTDS